MATQDVKEAVEALEALVKKTATRKVKGSKVTVSQDEEGEVTVDLSESIKETVDLGERCVECGTNVDESTRHYKDRKPTVVERPDKNYAGFFCTDCQPLEGTLMEPIVQALVERLYDERQVRTAIKRIGVEKLYDALVDPMLTHMELALQLER